MGKKTASAAKANGATVKAALDKFQRTSAFEKKAGRIPVPLKAPEEFFASSWSAVEMEAFVREYAGGVKQAFAKAKSKNSKVAVLDAFLRDNHERFTAFKSQRELNEAIEQLAKAQKDFFEDQYNIQKEAREAKAAGDSPREPWAKAKGGTRGDASPPPPPETSSPARKEATRLSSDLGSKWDAKAPGPRRSSIAELQIKPPAHSACVLPPTAPQQGMAARKHGQVAGAVRAEADLAADQHNARRMVFYSRQENRFSGDIFPQDVCMTPDDMDAADRAFRRRQHGEAHATATMTPGTEVIAGGMVWRVEARLDMSTPVNAFPPPPMILVSRSDVFAPEEAGLTVEAIYPAPAIRLIQDKEPTEEERRSIPKAHCPTWPPRKDTKVETFHRLDGSVRTVVTATRWPTGVNPAARPNDAKAGLMGAQAQRCYSTGLREPIPAHIAERDDEFITDSKGQRFSVAQWHKKADAAKAAARKAGTAPKQRAPSSEEELTSTEDSREASEDSGTEDEESDGLGEDLPRLSWGEDMLQPQVWIKALRTITLRPQEADEVGVEDLIILWRCADSEGTLNKVASTAILRALKRKATKNRAARAALDEFERASGADQARGASEAKVSTGGAPDNGCNKSTKRKEQPAPITPHEPAGRSTPASIRMHTPGPRLNFAAEEHEGAEAPSSQEQVSIMDIMKQAGKAGSGGIKGSCGDRDGHSAMRSVRKKTHEDPGVQGTDIAKIMHPDDMEHFYELYKSATEFDYDAPMATVERTWDKVYIPMVLSTGTSYMSKDADGNVELADKAKSNDADILVAATLKTMGGVPADARLAADIAIYSHRSGAKGASGFRESSAVFIVNALALDQSVRPTEMHKIKLTVWDQKNVRDTNSLRALTKKGKVEYRLLRPNWMSYPAWQADLTFPDGEGEGRPNQRRVAVTGTHWHVGGDKPFTQNAEFNNVRPSTAVDMHQFSMKVELNIRLPLVTALTATVAKAIAILHRDGAAPAGTPALKEFIVEKAPHVIILDPHAGVPRHRTATAARAAMIMSGVRVNVANADVLPMLYSTSDGTPMPPEYNTLSSTDFFASHDCVQFAKSLRQTCDAVRNGNDILEVLSMPTVISTSPARTQIGELVEAIDRATMVVAVEIVTHVLDKVAFKHLRQVGPPIPLPEQAFVKWGVNAFCREEMQVTLHVARALWDTIVSMPAAPRAGGMARIDEAYSAAHPIHANIPGNLIAVGDTGKHAAAAVSKDTPASMCGRGATKPQKSEGSRGSKVRGKQNEGAEKLIPALQQMAGGTVDPPTKKEIREATTASQLNSIWARAEATGTTETLRNEMGRKAKQIETLAQREQSSDEELGEALGDEADAPEPSDEEGDAGTSVRKRKATDVTDLVGGATHLPKRRKRQKATGAAAGEGEHRDHESSTVSQNGCVSKVQLAYGITERGAIRRGLLEVRLGQFWTMTAQKGAGTAHDGGLVDRASYRALEPLLRQFGCVEGTEMEPWAAELGELRAMSKVQERLTVAFQSDDIEVIAWAAHQAGWAVTLSDGSARADGVSKHTTKGVRRARMSAGAAAMRFDRSTPACLMRVEGLIQTSMRAELEAGLVSVFLAPQDSDAINITDSEGLIKVWDMTPGKFLEGIGGGSRSTNTRPTVLLKWAQHIAAGRKVMMPIRAHCACRQQDAVDEYANDARALETENDSAIDINFKQCCEVIRAWGKSADTTPEGASISRHELFNDLMLRLDVAQLWCGRNAAKLRDAMIEPSVDAEKQLARVVDGHTRRCANMGCARANESTAAMAGKIERGWCEQMVEQTLRLTGTIRLADGRASKKPRHTEAYSAAQDIMTSTIALADAVDEMLEEHKPQTMEQWRTATTDMAATLDTVGHGTDRDDATKSAWRIIQDLARYLTDRKGEAEARPTRTYSQIKELIRELNAQLARDTAKLLAVEQQDFDNRKFGAIYGMWMRKGQSKPLSRAMAAALACNQVTCKIPPIDFVVAVANKSVCVPKPPAGFAFHIWTARAITPTPESLLRFGAPISKEAVHHEITRAKAGKAFPRISQMAKDMIKSVYRHDAGARRLLQKIEEFDPESHKESALQHWVEALDAAIGASPVSEDSKHAVTRLFKHIFDVIEITGVAQEAHNIMLLSPIFKNKVDLTLPMDPEELEAVCQDVNHFREVVQANATRTLYGSCIHSMWAEFSKANNLHANLQLAYMPGIDAMTVHHLRFDLVQMITAARTPAWSAKPISIAVLAADLKHFFSTFTTESREQVMEENAFPERRRRGIRAIHKNMTVAMVTAGKLTKKVPIDCELMGSGEACTLAAAASTSLNVILQAARRGFRLPPQELFGEVKAPEEFMVGGQQCDDITLFAGGFGRTPQQTVTDLQWQARATAEWAMAKGFIFAIDTDNPSKSKCQVYAVLRDEYGFQQDIPIDIELPTQEGMVRVPELPQAAAFKMLGVLRAREEDEQRAENNRAAVAKVTAKFATCLDSRFPAAAQAAYISNSVTGGLRWLAAKTAIKWSTVIAAVKSEAAEARAALGLAPCTLQAYIFASKEDGGCGVTESEAAVMATAPAALMNNLNAKVQYVRELTRYVIEAARQVNSIGRDANSPFFDWDMTEVTVDRLDRIRAPAIVITTLRCVITLGASVSHDQETDTWMVEIKAGRHQFCTGKAGTIKDAIRDIFRQRHKRAMLESPIDIEAKAAVTDAQRAGANRWRSKRSIAEGVHKTAVKACIDALPTAVNMYRWGLTATPRCHCGDDHGSMAHISQRCPKLSKLISERSQEVVQLCVEAIAQTGSMRWSDMGRPGCHPPAYLLPSSWVDKLEAVVEERNGISTAVKHTLPDITLVSAAAGSKITVVIADPTVCWSDLQASADRKIRAYTPLKRLIEAHLGAKCEAVHIVPIAFTARGTPPENWAEICQTLKINTPARALLDKIQASILGYLDKIFKMWQAQHIEYESNRRRAAEHR